VVGREGCVADRQRAAILRLGLRHLAPRLKIAREIGDRGGDFGMAGRQIALPDSERTTQQWFSLGRSALSLQTSGEIVEDDGECRGGRAACRFGDRQCAAVQWLGVRIAARIHQRPGQIAESGGNQGVAGGQGRFVNRKCFTIERFCFFGLAQQAERERQIVARGGTVRVVGRCCAVGKRQCATGKCLRRRRIARAPGDIPGSVEQIEAAVVGRLSRLTPIDRAPDCGVRGGIVTPFERGDHFCIDRNPIGGRQGSSRNEQQSDRADHRPKLSVACQMCIKPNRSG